MPDPSSPTGSGRDSHTGWWVAAGAVLVAVGLGWWLLSPQSAPAPDTPAGTARGAPAESAQLPEAEPAAWRPGAPRRLTIPTLNVDAGVVPVGAPGGTLIPPADPLRLGWWADGAKPGARQGSALITGHTVSSGGGALDDLETLRAGAEVEVRTDRGAISYAVRRVQIYSKGRLAERATEVFSQEVPGRLVLITCEDWNGSEYLSNVVVIVAPVPA